VLDEELDDPVLDEVVPLEELDDPVVVDEVVPVVADVLDVADAVAVVDVVPLVDDVGPMVPALVAVVDELLLLVFATLVLGLVAGSSEEQATTATPRVHVVSKSEARLSCLIVFGPEAAREPYSETARRSSPRSEPYLGPTIHPRAAGIAARHALEPRDENSRAGFVPPQHIVPVAACYVGPGPVLRVTLRWTAGAFESP